MHVERFESSLWETSSVLVAEGSSALLIDPGVTPDEIDRIDRRVAELGATVEGILVTHAHSDHLCGLGAFPAAEAWMGPLAAAVVDGGRAAESVAALAQAHGHIYLGQPRCDRVLEPGIAAQVGTFVVESLPMPGHTADGVGYRVRAADVLAMGDYISPYEYPFVYHSSASYRATVAAVLDILHSDPPALIVTGHGGLLDAGRAISIAEEDAAYLRELHAVVLDAIRGGAGHDAAVRAGASVEPPRPAGKDSGQRLGNARQQFAEISPTSA